MFQPIKAGHEIRAAEILITEQAVVIQQPLDDSMTPGLSPDALTSRHVEFPFGQ